jgi:hypothetical protein
LLYLAVQESGFEHDPEKHAPHLMRGGHRFSEKIMLKQVDFAVLTRTAARIECLPRAAPKRRHVLFSMTGCVAFAPMHALWPVSNHQ